MRLHEGGLWLVECGIASHRIVRSGVAWSGVEITTRQQDKLS